MADADDEKKQSVALSDICGAQMIERNCKIVCPQCGFIRDCTDP